MNILLIDDNPDFLELLSDAIRKKHYSVYTACNGFVALDILEQKKIHLIISDVVMPDTPIMSLVCTLKNKYPDIPVILVSAIPENGPMVTHSLRLGADGYIPKPLSMRSVFSAINRYKA